jgi:hypothetical protein
VLYSDDSGITTALFRTTGCRRRCTSTPRWQTYVIEGTIDHEGACGPGCRLAAGRQPA